MAIKYKSLISTEYIVISCIRDFNAHACLKGWSIIRKNSKYFIFSFTVGIINNDVVTWYKIRDIEKKPKTLSLQNIIVYCVVQQVSTLMTIGCTYFLQDSCIHIFPKIYYILQSSLALVQRHIYAVISLLHNNNISYTAYTIRSVLRSCAV